LTKKTWIVGGVVAILLLTCVGTGLVGLGVYALKARTTLCVSGTKASLTVDGPASFQAPPPLPLPPGSELVSCEVPVSAAILCRHDAGLASTYTIRDDGAFGIHIVGHALCRSLEDAASPVRRTPEPPEEIESD
jgi:hypothetical protein